MPVRSYQDQYVPIFEAAMEEEIGLYIETDQKKNLEAMLYSIRKENPAFADALTILQPTIEGHPNVFFIAKKTTELVDG
jgi:hypothetical protein